MRITKAVNILQQLPPEIEFLPPPPRYLSSFSAGIIPSRLPFKTDLYKQRPEVLNLGGGKGAVWQTKRREAIKNLLNWDCISDFSTEELVWVRCYGKGILNTEAFRRLRFQRFHAVNSELFNRFEYRVPRSLIRTIMEEQSPILMKEMDKPLADAWAAQKEYDEKYWLSQQRLPDVEWIANWQVLQHRMPPEFKAEVMQAKSQIDIAAKAKEVYPALNPTAVRLWLFFWQRQGKLLRAVKEKRRREYDRRHQRIGRL